MIAALSTALVVADSFDMHDGGAGWWILMALGMLLFWVMVIAGIVLIVRELAGGRSPRGGEDPLELLERRLAEGDISVEEFEQRRKVLESTGRPRFG